MQKAVYGKWEKYRKELDERLSKYLYGENSVFNGEVLLQSVFGPLVALFFLGNFSVLGPDFSLCSVVCLVGCGFFSKDLCCFIDKT